MAYQLDIDEHLPALRLIIESAAVDLDAVVHEQSIQAASTYGEMKTRATVFLGKLEEYIIANGIDETTAWAFCTNQFGIYLDDWKLTHPIH